MQARWWKALKLTKATISLELPLVSAFHSSRYVEKKSEMDIRKKLAIEIESHKMVLAKATEQNKSRSL